MNMERSAGPRVYVPINMPDHTSQPTYAVLELVGFSYPQPSSAGPHLLQSPALIASPPHSAMLCLPPAPSPSPRTPAMEAMDTAAGPTASFYALPGAARLSMSAPPLLPISHFPADSSALLLPSPSHLLPPPSHHRQQYHHARPYQPPAARLEVVNLESPPSSPSSLAPSSASSASRESSKEKRSGSSAPATSTQALPNASPVVRFAPSISDASSAFVNGSRSRPAANFSSSAEGPHICGLSMPRAKLSQITERDVTPTKISVSQTERETIVHTHSSNFRDVVRQLTGASSEDQDLLPVTLPARLANRVSNQSMVQNQSMGCKDLVAGAAASPAVGNGGGPSSRDQLGLRKAPLKLHERRKSTMKNLEKVTSAYSLYGAAEVSPITNPSPVTPLVSDFERFCNASTPTSQGSSGLSSPMPLLAMGKAAAEGAAGGRVGEADQQQESGCFFSLQCPQAGEKPPSSPLEKPTAPTLLSLFPESPSCSPHDRELHI